MKRRLLSQVFRGLDICLLCASRLRNVPTSQLSKRPLACRNFITSSRSLQGATGEAKKEDDEEEGFSMLRQNAGLSFPSRSKTATTAPPSKPDSPPQRAALKQSQNSPVSERRPIPQNPPPKRAHHRGQRFVPGNHEEQQGQNQFRRVRLQDKLERGEKDTVAFQPMRRSSPPVASSEQGPSSVTRNGLATYRFKPQPYVEDDEKEPRQPQRTWDRSHSQRRMQGLDRHSAVSQDTLPVRKLGSRFGPPGRTSQDASLQAMITGSRRTKPEQMTKGQTVNADSKDFNREIEIEPLNITTGTIDAPAGSSFDSLDGFHHRRAPRPDKRSRRSDRFDDVSDEATATTSIRNARPRGRSFDLAAHEAEEMLYGESGRRKKKKTKKAEASATVRPTLQLPEFVGVERLAQMLKVNVDTFIEKLEEEGFEGARYDHVLDSGTSAMFADLYGFEPLIAGTGSTPDLVARPPPEDVSALPSRPPIVTIMGHVDHGKTTILDYLRKSSVVSSEHGGITQHIGAFSVVMPGTNRQITFLDTPGHAAFLEMRRRGANVTDIVVLVVAADDSVKPQTIEAIKHALEANVQIIVAINKIDKPEADIERVKQDLTRHDIVVEDYGGDYQVIPVSGKTGKGMSDLEEAIITLSDVNDYRAEVDGAVEGWVIESKVTIAGRVATVLVRRGTLRPGDCIVAGTTWARVRTLRNDAGAIVDEAPPGTPVQVDGWRGEDPTAGLEVLQADSEDNAKDVVDLRLEQEENMKTASNMAAINNARSEEAEARAKVLAWERDQEWAKKSYGARPKDNEGWIEAEDSTGPKKIHFVVKADVAGSVEALVAAVSAIGNGEVAANVIYSATGLLTESDIRMLATTGEQGYAISFNQSIDGNVARLAEAAGLTILDHNIIYKVTDNVRDILADQLPPIVTQRVLGEAEIGQIFEVTIKRRKVKIAGCRVTNGTISRSHKVRVQRGSEVVFTGSLDSLKNVKKDVTEMRKGTECGMGFEEWEDFQQGDQVQSFEEHHEKRTLY